MSADRILHSPARVGRRLVLALSLLGATVALAVALGAVLVAQPFDAWTPPPAGQSTEVPTGEHALDPAEEHESSPGGVAQRHARRLLRSKVAGGKTEAVRRRIGRIGRRARLPIVDPSRFGWVPSGVLPDRAPPAVARR